MEIGEEERYASGALFTLALHLTQVEFGAGGEAPGSAWGAGTEDEWEEEARLAEEHREPSQAVWAAYWGFDSCGPGGILDRLYTALRIPQKSWGGLKRLPEVGGISYERRHSYMHLVSNFLQVLDSTLPTAHVISRNYRPSMPAQPAAAGAGRHVGYLPQVDDLLGLHPDAKSQRTDSAEADKHADTPPPGQDAQQDPFAASSQALRMKSDSMALSAAQQQSMHPITTEHPLTKGDEGIAQLNSSAAKQREAELQLDDSDSDMEADVVFAHVMARQHGGHARRQPPQTPAHVQRRATANESSQPSEQREYSATADGLLHPLEQVQQSGAASGPPQDMQHKALDPHQGSHSLSLAGRDISDAVTAVAEDLHTGRHGDLAAASEGCKAAQHVSAVADSAGSRTMQPTVNEADTTRLAQHVFTLTDAAATQVSAIGRSGEAASDAAAQPMSSTPSLQRSISQHRGKKPSQKAVAAMWELLECSIAPQLQLDPGQGSGSKKPEHLPRVRWYDARVRTALRKTASWLNVPWPAVGNFEHLLAYQVLLPSQPGDAKKHSNTWEQGLWAAKVGATTVGIGALFAVTGGLAAPAIAAGIGAAISLAGGGAAAAAGATGFLATTAGAAAVMSSMGVAGGSYAGAHMARRIGGVKELGFWEVNSTTLQDVHEVAPSQEELQAAAEGTAPPEADRPAQDDIEAAKPSSSGATEMHAPEQGWVTDWDEPKASSLAGLTRDSKMEPPRAFSPVQSQNLDDFLQSSSAGKHGRKPSQTSGVLMELKEMPSLPRAGLELGAYVKPEAPVDDHGYPDAGHLSFLAMPRPATPPLVITESRPAAPGRSAAAAASSASAPLPASAGTPDKPESKSRGTQDSKPSKAAGDRERRFWGAGAKHGSNASLDSAGSAGGQKAPAASSKGSKQWLWKPKWKEPALLLAPVSHHSCADDMRMSVTIGVSGWISERKDYLKVWSRLEAPDSEVFSLVWESKALIALNSAIGSFMAQQAYQEVAKWAITHFFYTGLVAALATPWILVSFSQMIDHAWAVALNRAQKAGILLAHILMSGAHGDRPVTLIGYSMGARLIFHCLLELCRHSAKGIVEHVVVMGAPVSSRLERWAMARSVVAGRFVNAYSRRDWVLGLIYRGANGFVKGAGGLCPLNCTGIENINLTSIIAGHFDYISKMEEILELVAIQSSR